MFFCAVKKSCLSLQKRFDMKKILRLREACAKAGKIQRDIVPFLGISESSLSTALKRGTLTINQLEKISEALGIPVYELFERPEPFLAVVLKDGQTHTFDSEDALRDFLFPGSIPLLKPEGVQTIMEEHGAISGEELR